MLGKRLYEMYLPKELFFAVWDLPELRELIRSFMWPGRRSATWYKYRDLVAACANGYRDLVAARSSSLKGGWCESLDVAADAGHVELVELISNNRLLNFYGDVSYERIQRARALRKCARSKPTAQRIKAAITNRVERETFTLITRAIKASDIQSLKHLCLQAPPSVVRQVLASGLTFNTAEVLEWLYNNVAEFRHSVSFPSQLKAAVDRRYKRISLDAMKWFVSRGYKIDENTFWSRVSYGDCATVKWLSAMFEPKDKQALLNYSIVSGTKEMIELFYDRTNSTIVGEDIDQLIENGDIGAAVWLQEVSGVCPTWEAYLALIAKDRHHAEWVYDVITASNSSGSDDSDDGVVIIQSPKYHPNLPFNVRQRAIRKTMMRGNRAYSTFRDLTAGCSFANAERQLRSSWNLSPDAKMWLEDLM